MKFSRLIGLIAVLALSSCAPEPQEARPALWELTGPQGQQAWLFGTIHALDRPARWQSGAVGPALAQAGTIIVEVANIDDGAAMAETFSKLARTPGLPALSRRVAPSRQSALDGMMRRAQMSAAASRDLETWAAALVLARATSPEMDRQHGIDRAVIAAADDRPVLELEGAAAQLAIFDRLPEKEQRDLLELVLDDTGALSAEDSNLARAWREGDMGVIEAETRTGLLADPELREALFTARNRAWTKRIAAATADGRRPFVAVGAAHMAGPDGLPAMLAKSGFKVRRIQ